MIKKRGFALVVAIFVVVIFSVLGVVIVSLMSGESLVATGDYSSIRAFHLAEAGFRYTLASSLAADSDWSNNSNFTMNLSPGYFTVSYTYRSHKTCVIKVTGVVNGISRSISWGIVRSGLSGAFSYGIYCDNINSQTLYINNSCTIYGDFYYDGPVVMQNNAKLVNGTLYSDSLTLNNSASVASWEPIQAPVNPPLFDTSYYDNLLKETTMSATSALNLTNSAVLNLSGQTLYYTSISISNSARVNGPGTLVATTGNFQLVNSASIGDNVTVIVKGTSSLGNSAAVGSNFNLISNGSISLVNNQSIPSGATFFTYGDVPFSNSSTFNGSILAPSGEVSSTNSTVFNGLLYAAKITLSNSTKLNGAAAVNQIGVFSNSVQVRYDPSKFPSTIPQGLEGAGGSASSEAIIINSWSEGF